MTIDRAWFARSAAEYERAAAGSGFPLDRSQIHPCDDRSAGASFDRHYIHADMWAAEKILAGPPGPHVDVGSRVDGFCTHLLAAGRNVGHVDMRNPGFTWPRFRWVAGDARWLDPIPDASVASLSCLHAAEHVGLGRYGDWIDPLGMEKAMASLARVLAPGGRLYFAVPVGRQRVVFNAHRVAAPGWVTATFAAHGLALERFAAVDDAGAWHPEASPADFAGADYACGMFELSKPRAT